MPTISKRAFGARDALDLGSLARLVVGSRDVSLVCLNSGIVACHCRDVALPLHSDSIVYFVQRHVVVFLLAGTRIIESGLEPHI